MAGLDVRSAEIRVVTRPQALGQPSVAGIQSTEDIHSMY